MGVPYAEVIGDPIAHSKSPAIHKFWLAKLGLEGDYRATRVTAEELPGYFEARRADPDWRGCNVTMPLKRSVEKLLDRIDSSSEWADATNCVYWDGDELWGCNTDASGAATTIDGASIYQKPVVVIGSGAAARAALWMLAMEEAGELRVVARNEDRAYDVLDGLRPPSRWFPIADAAEAFSGATVVVNASPLGMSGFAAMPANLLTSLRETSVDARIVDMVYDPVETGFLVAAREYGRRFRDGLVMLIGQAQDSFGHFFDDSAPEYAWEDAELRKLLTS